MTSEYSEFVGKIFKSFFLIDVVLGATLVVTFRHKKKFNRHQ